MKHGRDESRAGGSIMRGRPIRGLVVIGVVLVALGAVPAPVGATGYLDGAVHFTVTTGLRDGDAVIATGPPIDAFYETRITQCAVPGSLASMTCLPAVDPAFYTAEGVPPERSITVYRMVNGVDCADPAVVCGLLAVTSHLSDPVGLSVARLQFVGADIADARFVTTAGTVLFDDVYRPDLEHVQRTLTTGTTERFVFQVQNDGPTTDDLIVHAPRGYFGISIRYVSGYTDITAAVTSVAGARLAAVPPGGVRTLVVDYTTPVGGMGLTGLTVDVATGVPNGTPDSVTVDLRLVSPAT